MSRSSQEGPLSDRIPASLSTEIEKTFTSQISSEIFRKRVKEIFDDYVDSVPFMKKIKEYAGEKIDDELYKSIGFWIKTVLIPVGVTIATAFIMKSLKIL